MHDEALRFVKAWAPDVARGARVIEVGSYDRNGHVRNLFAHTHYLGIDIEPGPGVDIAVPDPLAWEPPWRPHAVVSTETFEHVDQWCGLVGRMASWLQPGGMFIATCAGPRRKPHAADGSRGGPKPGEHYANIGGAQMMDVLTHVGFIRAYVALVRDEMDLQVVAWAPDGCGRISCPR